MSRIEIIVDEEDGSSQAVINDDVVIGLTDSESSINNSVTFCDLTKEEAIAIAKVIFEYYQVTP